MRVNSSSPNVDTVALQIIAPPQRTIAAPSVRVRRTRSASTPNGRLASAATSDVTLTSRPMSVLLIPSAWRSGVADAPTVDASALLSASTAARSTMTRVRPAPPVPLGCCSSVLLELRQVVGDLEPRRFRADEDVLRRPEARRVDEGAVRDVDVLPVANDGVEKRAAHAAACVVRVVVAVDEQ